MAETQELKEDTSPAGLRAALERRDAELKEARETINTQKVRLMEKAFEDAGLDPTKGIGKAIAKEFEGEPSKDALQAYAREEYGWEPTPSEKAEEQQSIQAARARVGATMGMGTSVPTQEIDLQIAEAEKKGDFAASMSLKMQKWRTETGR